MTKSFAFQLGMLALIGSVASAACSSDETSNPPGQGGSSGSGGSTAGKGGAGGSTGGKAGTGGASGGSAGKGGSGGGAGTSVGGSSGSGGTGGGAGTSGTGGASGEGGGSGEGGAQGGADSGGEGGADGTGACNSLVNTGPQIAEEEESGTLPTVTGGTLPDGTYVLTRRQDWDGTCNCTQRRTFVFSQSASHVEIVAQGEDNSVQNLSGSVSFQNDQITITFTCGPSQFLGQSMTLGYSVIPGSPLVYQTWDTNNGHLQLETYEQQ